MKNRSRLSISDRLKDRQAIQDALRRAIREAARNHVNAGLPMAAWKDGKVVWTSAEEVLARPDRDTPRQNQDE